MPDKKPIIIAWYHLNRLSGFEKKSFISIVIVELVFSFT